MKKNEIMDDNGMITVCKCKALGSTVYYANFNEALDSLKYDLAEV